MELSRAVNTFRPLVLTLPLVAAFVAATMTRAKAQGPAGLPAYLNTKPGVAYVGSEACKTCHPDIWATYSRTDMGRSMSLGNDPAEIQRAIEPVTVYDRTIDRYFKVFTSNGQMYQSEYAVESGGGRVSDRPLCPDKLVKRTEEGECFSSAARMPDLETEKPSSALAGEAEAPPFLGAHVAFEQTERIAYAVGAGENGFSYLIDRDGYLFQAPLSYYSKIGKWDLSPAHEMGFTRAIEEACIYCHAGLPQPVANRVGLYRQPAFQDLAIGCEKCHGPGELHVKARLAGEAIRAGGDSTIVNPARLPSWLSDNVCMYCHEKGDTEALQDGQTYLDFRPGTPLDATLAIFKVPLKAGTAEASPLLNHYYLMTLSKCYRSRSGGLSCLSCHDPHVRPSAADAPSYYKRKCLDCHSTGSCSLTLTARRSTIPPDDCVGCHMPKRNLTSILHSALTDHRIPARPGEPFPAEAYRARDSAFPGLIHLTAVPGGDDSVPLLTLLNAYAGLAEAGPVYQAQYRRLLAQAASASPSNPQVLSLLARDALAKDQQASPRSGRDSGFGVRGWQKFTEAPPSLSSQSGRPAWTGKSGGEAEAIDDLTQAIRLGSTWPGDYELLGQLLARAGRFEEAVTVLNRELALAPYSASLYALLGACYAGLGNQEAAIKTLRDGLKLFPADASMREMSQKIAPAASGSTAEPTASATHTPAGKEVRLLDLEGHPIDPFAPSGARATVFVFTRTDCPISNRYAPEIQRIYREFAPDHIAFWLVYLDPDQAVDSVRQHLKEYNYPFGGLRDPQHGLVRLTGVRVTPEVAVFTPGASGARMVYRGRIDDKYVDLGQERPQPTTHDLERVLKAIVEGKPVGTETTRAVGCFISDLEK